MMRVWLSLLFSLLSAPAFAACQATVPYVFSNGTVADATQVNANYNAITNGMSTSCAGSGSNSDITALNALSTPVTPAQGGSTVYIGATSAGTATAQTVATTVPSNFTLTAGRSLTFLVGNTNTGPTTLAVNGLTATNVYKLSSAGPVPLTAGELVAGQYATVTFDGTQFELVTDSGYLLGGQSSLASATTTDLGTALTHNVLITGTTTITSFGVNGTTAATTAQPYYFLTFAASVQVTYNATSMQIAGGASAQFNAGDRAEVEYLGTGNWRITKAFSAGAPPQSVGITPAYVQGHILTNDGTTPATKVDWSFSSAVLTNVTGHGLAFTTGSPIVVNLSTTGVGGLDTGSIAASTWYYCYGVSNGVLLNALCSTSSTYAGASQPSGYVFSVYLGAIRTDGSANLLRTYQRGDRTVYKVTATTNTAALPTMSSGSSGSTSISTSGFVPTTATQIQGFVSSGASNGNVCASPNSAYPTGYGTVGAATCVFTGSIPFDEVLEAASIYYVSGTGTGSMVAYGWRDQVNAH